MIIRRAAVQTAREIEEGCSTGKDGYRQYAHMTERVVAVVVQRLRQVIFFDVRVMEIADNLHMFKIVFRRCNGGHRREY